LDLAEGTVPVKVFKERKFSEIFKKYRVTQKTGTFEMRSGSHVQLAALRNRDLELQTTSPFSIMDQWNGQQRV